MRGRIWAESVSMLDLRQGQQRRLGLAQVQTGEKKREEETERKREGDQTVLQRR